jgi:hypothetical protein
MKLACPCTTYCIKMTDCTEGMLVVYQVQNALSCCLLSRNMKTKYEKECNFTCWFEVY